MPDAYDPPAACIAALCRIGSDWHAVRLGDCRLLAEDRNGFRRIVDFANDDFDHWVTAEAMRLRGTGMSDLKDIARAMRQVQFDNRRRRNRPGGYGVIEADRACLAFAEYMELDEPSSVLLTSDGFFRLVDYYGQMSETDLLARSGRDGELARLYDMMRKLEDGDPDGARYPRFKPKDDASAIALIA